MTALRPDLYRGTFLVNRELYDHVRNIVARFMGHPDYMTIQDFMESAIANEITRLEQERNHGQPFPPRPAELSSLRGRTFKKQ